MSNKNISILAVTIAFVTTACSTDAEQEAREEAEEIMHMHDISFHTSGNGDPYIGTHHGLLHVNIDNQTMVWEGSPEERHDFMGLTILEDGVFISSGHPSPASDLGNPLGAMRSEDAGESWEVDVLYEEVDFHHLVESPADASILYGFDAYNGHLYSSRDAGQEWTIVNEEDFNDQEILEIFADAEDSEVLAAASPYGIYRSEDGGGSWEHIQQETTALSSTPYDDGHLVYGVGEQEGWFYTEDLGETLEAYDMALPDEPIIAFDRHGDTIAAGGTEDSLYLSFDGGASWEIWIDKGEPIAP
ncbi:F510_1955 family glycosylhydrolase [Bacillus daqingensis]|uniref:Photosynthesis system II assembly factor Ycf48/Hcf136-like domain-containing protein n=2 Tax=Bacillaceae TaxID=186817 RepID=A0A969PNI0_9BACI|nr:hypothetical protein [Alkalicoccus luteus]